MKIVTIIAIVIFSVASLNMNAQVVNGSYEKLAKYYNEGKYERCLYKADDYTYREEYSKDPEPYLYISMCLLKLSQSDDPDLSEDYKTGEKQAIKYAGTFAKKDKNDDLYSDNIEYINSLKKLQKAKIKESFNEANFRRAATYAKAFNKLNREQDNLITFYVGMNEILSKNLTQGEKHMQEAEAEIKTVLKEGTLKVDKIFKTLLIDGFMKYTEIKIAEGEKEEAKKVITLAKDIFPNDGYIKVQYNVIMQAEQE